MVDFTETQITGMMKFLKDYGGVDPDNITRELAILELEDIKRKGCTLEHICECHGCSASTKENNYCPLHDWEKRHPEYKDDELAVKIKILETGGEAAYKFKLKAQEEAKRKAEEEKNRAKDEDRIDAACKVLQIIRDSKQPISAHMINVVVDLIRNEKTTKLELEDAIAKIQS